MQKCLQSHTISHDSDSERHTKVASRKHSIFLTPERSKLRSVLANQNDKCSLQKTHWRRSTSSRKVWWLDNRRSRSLWWRRWISKQSPIRSRGTRSCQSMDPSISVQDQKLLKKHKGACKSSWSQVRRQFILNLANPVKICHGIIEIRHSIDLRWCCCKSSTQNKGRDICCTAAIRLGWKMVGWFCGMQLLSAKMFKTSWQTGKTPHERRCGEPFQRPRDSFWRSGRMSSEFFTRPVKAPPTWQESFSWHIPRICIDRGENLKRRTWTRQKSILEDSMPKKSWRRKGWTFLLFPVADGTAKLSGRDHEFLEPEGPRPTQKIDAEARKETSGRHKVTSFIVMNIESRVSNLCAERGKQYLFHWRNWRDQSYLYKSGRVASKNVWTTIGTSIRTENCQIPWHFPQISLYWKKNLPRDICGPGRRLTKIQATARPENFVARSLVPNWKKPLRRKKSKNGQTRNESSIMFESWEAFISSIRKNGEHKETIKNARKTKVPMEAAMPCKKEQRSTLQETAINKACVHCGSSWINKKAIRNHLYRKVMKITSQAKNITRGHITIWCTSLFLCLKRWKFRRQKL